MATILTKKEDIELLRESGKRLSRALDAISEAVVPGATTKDLDEVAEKTIRQGGDIPALLNYQPDGAEYPYPATLCVSINDEIVHGIPSKNRILKEGDIVGLDLVINHKGMMTDSARTVPVGKVDKKYHELMETTRASLREGIKVVKPGGHIGDIGFAVESYVKPFKYGIIRELGGHGVGRHVHEEPYIANFGKRGTGPKIVEGMVLAIEPMLAAGGRFISLSEDGYTIRTADGSRSAHFEHTILVTANGAEIMTKSE